MNGDRMHPDDVPAFVRLVLYISMKEPAAKYIEFISSTFFSSNVYIPITPTVFQHYITAVQAAFNYTV